MDQEKLEPFDPGIILFPDTRIRNKEGKMIGVVRLQTSVSKAITDSLGVQLVNLIIMHHHRRCCSRPPGVKIIN